MNHKSYEHLQEGNNDNIESSNNNNSNNRRLSVSENESLININEDSKSPNVIINNNSNNSNNNNNNNNNNIQQININQNGYGLLQPPPLSTSNGIQQQILTPRKGGLSTSTSSTSSLISSPINKSSNAIKNTTGPPNSILGITNSHDNYTPVPISPNGATMPSSPVSASIIQDIIREKELAEEEDFKQIGSAILTSSTTTNGNQKFESIDLIGKQSESDTKSLLKKNKDDLGSSSNKLLLKQSSSNVPHQQQQGGLNRSTALNRSSILKSSTNSLARSTGLKLSQMFVNPLLYSVASEDHMVLTVSSEIKPPPSHLYHHHHQHHDVEMNILERDELQLDELKKNSNSEQFDGFPDGADEMVEEDLSDETIGGEVQVIKNDSRIMKIWNSYQGLLLLVLSAFLFSIMAYIVKKLSSELSSLEIAFFRSVYGLVACVLILVSLRDNPLGPKQFRFFLSLRGLSGTISLCAYFYTIKVLPLSEAVIISFTSPVITAALAAVLLKEKWGPIEALCAFLSLCGVTIISKPSFLFHQHNDGSTASNGDNDPSKLLYIFIGIGGAFFTAVSYIAVRKVGPTVNPFILVIYFSGISSFITLPSAFIFQFFAWPSLKTWGYITLMGVIGTVAQGAVNRGIQLEKAAKAAAMNYLQIIFTFIWEITFLHETIDWVTLLGAGLILSCAGITAFRK